jgi:hypothetical protein
MRRFFAISLLTLSSSLLTLSAQSWLPVGTGMNGNVMSLYSYDSILYAGGTFTTAGGNPANNIAQWNNTNWSALSTGVNGTVYAIAKYNGKIYAGGKFDSAGGLPARNIAAWDGTKWLAVDGGLSDTVRALTVYNGQLYAGGVFDSAGGKLVNYVAGWNGTSWSALVSGSFAPVYALNDYRYWNYIDSSFDSVLMVGTITTDTLIYYSATPNYIAAWNDSTWIYDTGISSYSASYFNRIYAFADFYGTLTTGGSSCDTTVAEGDLTNYVSQWSGYLWAATIAWATPGGGPQGGPVYALAVSSPFDSVLYAGGAFTSVNDTVPVNYVASCTAGIYSDTWDSVGSGVNGPVYALAFYNGQLYAGGTFTDYYSKETHPNNGGSGTDRTVTSYTANHIATYKPLVTTGIKNIPTNHSVKLFPNPNNGVFTIERSAGKESAVVEVYNILGEKALTLPLSQTGEGTKIDMSAAPDGVYLYRVLSETGDLVSTGKFVINH